MGEERYQSCRRAQKGGAHYSLWLHPLTEHATKEGQAVSTPFWTTGFLHENLRPRPGLLFITRRLEANMRTWNHEVRERNMVHWEDRGEHSERQTGDKSQSNRSWHC
ncbi:hypothetical protein CRG98_047789, partial [Punica granatum]